MCRATRLDTRPCFTPRLPAGQRPKYPELLPFLLWHGALPTVQAAFWSTVVAQLWLPAYLAAVSLWQQQQWSEPTFISASLAIVSLAMYFGYNSVYLAMENFQLLEQFRIGRTPGQHKSTLSNIRFTLIRAAVSKVFVIPLLVYYVVVPVMKACGSPSFDDAVPSVPVMAGEFAIAYWFNEFFFYWGHRLLHADGLYARFHKEHHNYTGTVGVAAEHAGPVEQVFSNIIPTIGGCLFFGRHPYVLLCWIVMRLHNTYDGHSGYCFSETWLGRIGLLSAASAYHDYHHTFSFRGNFGHPLLDYLCGTMDFWLKDGGRKGYLELQRKNDFKLAQSS